MKTDATRQKVINTVGITGILANLIFSILKFDNALFLACLNGITNFIPFVGPYIGGIIPVLIGFTKSISTGLVVTIIMVILQTIEGNIIHPLIIMNYIKNGKLCYVNMLEPKENESKERSLSEEYRKKRKSSFIFNST